MNVKRKLEEEFENQIDGLHKLELGSEKYKLTVDGVTKLADRIIEIEKNEKDAELREVEIENDALSKEAEIKNNRNRNVVEVIKVGVPVVAAFAMGLVSMKWEKLDTLTSSAGKSALRDVLKFR